MKEVLSVEDVCSACSSNEHFFRLHDITVLVFRRPPWVRWSWLSNTTCGQSLMIYQYRIKCHEDLDSHLEVVRYNLDLWSFTLTTTQSLPSATITSMAPHAISTIRTDTPYISAQNESSPHPTVSPSASTSACSASMIQPTGIDELHDMICIGFGPAS